MKIGDRVQFTDCPADDNTPSTITGIVPAGVFGGQFYVTFDDGVVGIAHPDFIEPVHVLPPVQQITDGVTL